MTIRPTAVAGDPAALDIQTPCCGRCGDDHPGVDSPRRRVVYQPLVNLQTLDVVGAEALTRFGGPTARGRTVASMIRDLERNRGIVGHGRWLLSQSAYEWWKVGPRGWRLNLNISPIELNRPDYVDDLLRWYARGHIALELTESSSQALSLSGMRNRARLKELAIPLVLDDLGDGQSSIQRMLALNLTEVKLSRRWAAEIGVRRCGERQLSLLLRRLHDLGRSVTVEGVETVEQLDWLRHHGVQNAQGFVVAAPMPMDELRSWKGLAPGLTCDEASGGFAGPRKATTEPAAQ